MFPSKLGPSAPDSESIVHEALGSLSDDWVVISQVGLTHLDRHGSRRDGETDFVLLHPAYGLLLIEAKGGGYQARGRRWHRWEPDRWVEMPRSPVEQAKSNKYAVVDYLTASNARPLSTGWAVVFTSGQPSGAPGPDASAQVLLGPTDLADMPATIDRVVRHWGMTRGWAEPSGFSRSLTILAPDMDVVDNDSTELELARGSLDRLFRETLRFTEDQLTAQNVCGGRNRMAVLGPAGTGKTLLARVRANALVESGYRPALISDRWGVSSALAVLVPLDDEVVAGAPHEVLGRLTQAPVPDDPVEMVARAGTVAGREQAPTALVIDEAQALPVGLFEALVAMVPADAPVYVYGDPYQRDSDALWRPLGFPEVWVTSNCRNAEAITRVLSRLSGAQYASRTRTSPRPMLVEVDHVADAVSATARLAAREASAVGQHRVAVLAPSQAMAAVRQQLRSQGVAPRSLPDDHGVTLQTPDGFRGGESDVVIYLRGGAGSRDDYVALSRACVRAYVVTERGSWEDVRHLFNPEEAT
jgi:hypothetical protein